MSDHPSNAEKFEAFTDDALDTIIDWLRDRPSPSETECRTLHLFETERHRRRHG